MWKCENVNGFFVWETTIKGIEANVYNVDVSNKKNGYLKGNKKFKKHEMQNYDGKEKKHVITRTKL